MGQTMKCIWVFTILLVPATGRLLEKTTDTNSRIAGGLPVDNDGRFPYVGDVLIRLESGIGYFCGATLISPTAVLTAAHCLDDPTIASITVEFGKISSDDTSVEKLKVESFEVHPGYEKDTFKDDVAILQLSEAATAVPAHLPFGEPRVELYDPVSVVGYGFLNPGQPSDKLMEIVVGVQQTENCAIFNLALDDENQFCAGGDGKVPCMGDSGGPAVARRDGHLDTVVGIVSYGGGDCYWYPAVFTRVEAYEDFITENVCYGFNKPSWCPEADRLETEVQQVFIVTCFSGSNVVEEADRGLILMEDLQLGDKVHVGNGDFEPIYSFGHLAPTMDADFLQVTTERSKVTLTSDHMVFTQSRGAIKASLLQEGEYLISTHGVDRVKAVRTVRERGVYAPFTPSGKIVANGILASSFVALEDNEGIELFGGLLTLSHQWLAHATQLPHRLVCYHFGSCPTEEYSPEGISLWVNKPLKASQWLLHESGNQKCFWVGAVFLVATLFSVLEVFVLHPYYLVAMLIFAVATKYRVVCKRI